MQMDPVGIIHSCFKEKFGIPRQPGLVPEARSRLELLAPFNNRESVRGIEGFSHLWILFLFHRSQRGRFRSTVRPPRLGGSRRLGVFATRSNYRPNPIGLSVVRLCGVRDGALELQGGDFLDGTPVLDIKPYLPYADSIPGATGGFADTPPCAQYSVVFSPGAEEAVRAFETSERPALRGLICSMLQYDPRPASRRGAPDGMYATRLFDLDVHWCYKENQVCIESVIRWDGRVTGGKP